MTPYNYTNIRPILNKKVMLVSLYDAPFSTLGNARYARARQFGIREFPCSLDARRITTGNIKEIQEFEVKKAK